MNIVITGLGLVLPGAHTPEAARAILESLQPQFQDPPEGEQGRRAVAQVLPGLIPAMQARRLDRTCRFAWAAAALCLKDAGLDPAAFGGERIAVALGTRSGGDESTEAFLRAYLPRGPEGASPLLFPNAVANAATGHVAVAFGLKGPSATQLERENGAFMALDQAVHWLALGRCDAALVMGSDGHHPLVAEISLKTGLMARHGDPLPHGGTGFLPGEGAQALLLERKDAAHARGARIRARLGALAAAAHADRAQAQARALAQVLHGTPDRWIAGANGHLAFDRAETALPNTFDLPAPDHPKALWGERCGSGGLLLAAALLRPARQVLITAPATYGPQFAVRVEDVEV